MSSNRLTQTVGDYVAIALCPVLIMGLVASLVFYLVDVVYVGQYESRINWVLGCFIFAATLVVRIGLTMGFGRAIAYGVALAVAAALAMNKFIEFTPGGPLAAFSLIINLALMALIWGCIYKLTRDCTHIDDAETATGEGLLQAAGLDDRPPEVEGVTQSAAELEEEAAEKTKWDRMTDAFQEPKKKARAPGVWVVYFSFAALPLFGLGQLLVPAAAVERRRYLFWLVCAYVACGLGLLLATSFLGLRRYLRQRKVTMPVKLAGVWLGFGAALIAGILLASWLLPRPNPEYSVARMTGLLGSKEQKASKFAPKKDSPAKGKGSPSPEKHNEPDAKSGPAGKTDKSATTSRPGQTPDKTSSSAGKSSSQGGKQGNEGKTGDGKSKTADDQGRRQEGREPAKRPDSRDAGKRPEGKDSAREQEDADKREAEKESDSSSGGSEATEQGDDSSSQQSEPMSSLQSDSWLANALKWLIGIIVVLVVGYLLLRYFGRSFAWARDLLQSLRDFWASLFGRKDEKPRAAEEREEVEPEVAREPRPFASFLDPFQAGTFGQFSREELIRYSFEALESWAWEHHLGRQPEETPLEFADRLGERVPALKAEARRLAELYSEVTYTTRPAPPDCVGALKRVWQRLAVRAVPAGEEAAAR
jgi:hypothetical protein